jgi:hypothetical protein
VLVAFLVFKDFSSFMFMGVGLQLGFPGHDGSPTTNTWADSDATAGSDL